MRIANVKEAATTIRKFAGRAGHAAGQVLFGVVLAASIPFGTFYSTPVTIPAIFVSQLKVDVRNPFSLISLQTQRVEIKPGESRADQEAREARAREEVLARGSAYRLEVGRPTIIDPDLATKRALAQRAAAAYGISWEVLEAVWQAESGKAYITTVRSYAGAQGPLQFMPGTWRTYAVDGNGDGTADVYNAEDAIYGAAKLLAANGAASGNVHQALLAYNHAEWYVQKVLNLAREIGYGG